jgi:hypothetical protein
MPERFRFLMGARPALALMALLAGPALPLLHAATGTDVVAGIAGYRWKDSADGAVAEPAGFDAGSVTIAPADDAAPTAVALPFAFPFYGTPRSTVYISDNGWIGFAGPYANGYPTPAATIPDAAAPNAYIAAYWDQLLCNNAAAGLRIKHGLAAAGQAYLLDVAGTQVSTGAAVTLRLYLYRTGVIRIQFQPLSGRSLTLPTVGIENDAGTDGCRVTAGGNTSPGVPPTVPAGYVIEFEPPPIFPTQCAGIPSIPCGTSGYSLPGTGPQFVAAYGCPSVGNDARERVVSFTLTDASVVGLTVTPGTATNLRMYVLASCNERDCIAGPALNASLNLGPGTYYVVVDAAAMANEGTYTLSVTCATLATPTTCGSTVSGSTAGGRTLFPGYACAGAVNLSGREAYYQVDLAAPTNLRAQLSGLSANLDVLIMPVGPGLLAASDCVAWGDNLAVGWNARPGSYLIIVDGVGGAAGNFTLQVDCRIDSTCGSPAGLIDFGSGRVQTVSGDTTTGANVVTQYSCDPATTYDGSELVYELILPQPGQVLALQTGGTPGLSFFILDDCNEGTCLGTDCGAPLAAGTHYLVVDGAAGVSGPFDILVAYEEQFNHWTTCEPPYGLTMPGDHISNFWHWHDGAYCYTDPMSFNYPNGCTFAMYTVVQCGTAMHIPLYDVESGHVRVFDVFRGQYVSLNAVSGGGWAMSGTDIFWQDCSGTDPRWNDQMTDISFSDPNGLCGLFRIEFPEQSGAEWELFANCTGSRAGQFDIHDSLCSALTDYMPLPNLTLSAASVVANCPDVTITYTVRNDGCGLARNVPVNLMDNGTLVASDILPQAPFGQSTTRTFSATFPGPTTSVTLEVDPDNLILECNETGGIACDPAGGVEWRPLPGCVPGACSIVASATATPPLTCALDPVVIDASASGSVNCTGGALEYQLSDAGGVLVPWTASAVFPAQFPTRPTDYIVEARCAALPACSNATQVTVDVERPPALDPMTVNASDPSNCNLGIRVSWGAATFFGPSGTGYYNIYRSTTSCADALTRPPLVQGIFAVAYSDTSTVEGPTYFYVVEAEDGTPATVCTQRGPVVNGPSTRVDAIAGTCTGVTDSASPRPDLLPRVGGTLRLGGFLVGLGRRYGETFVDLQWGTDRPLNAFGGEHFHVLRSERPDNVVSLMVPEPPFVSALAVRDANADDTVGNVGLHVWHYLVFVSDACENDNRGYDNP